MPDFPMRFLKTYEPIGATLAVLSVAVIPGAHWLLLQTTKFNLLGAMEGFSAAWSLYKLVFLSSFLAGYVYLLVSVRSLRRIFGRIEGTILLIILLLTCPFGGFVAYRMRARSTGLH